MPRLSGISGNRGAEPSTTTWSDSSSSCSVERVPGATGTRMVLLAAPFDRARAATLPVPWGAGLQIAVAALAIVLAGYGLEMRGGPSASIGRTLAGAAVHAGFLGL